MSQRGIKAYACWEAANILESAVSTGCMWCLSEDQYDEFGPAVEKAIMELVDELHRRGDKRKLPMLDAGGT